MNPQTISLVQESWRAVQPIADQAAELFYGRLFETAPHARALFKGDMQAQGRKLMTMIGTAVNGLTRLDRIVPAVQDLGRRHVPWGVQPADYDKVGAALLWTLEQGLGPAFTPDVKAAWTETYGLLAGVMKEAAYGTG